MLTTRLLLYIQIIIIRLKTTVRAVENMNSVRLRSPNEKKKVNVWASLMTLDKQFTSENTRITAATTRHDYTASNLCKIRISGLVTFSPEQTNNH